MKDIFPKRDWLKNGDSMLFVIKVVQHKRGGVLFLGPVMFQEDIHGSPHWIRAVLQWGGAYFVS